VSGWAGSHRPSARVEDLRPTGGEQWNAVPSAAGTGPAAVTPAVRKLLCAIDDQVP